MNLKMILPITKATTSLIDNFRHSTWQLKAKLYWKQYRVEIVKQYLHLDDGYSCWSDRDLMLVPVPRGCLYSPAGNWPVFFGERRPRPHPANFRLRFVSISFRDGSSIVTIPLIVFYVFFRLFFFSRFHTERPLCNVSDDFHTLIT